MAKKLWTKEEIQILTDNFKLAEIKLLIPTENLSSIKSKRIKLGSKIPEEI